MSQQSKNIAGMLAAFASTEALIHAAEKMRDAGYKEFDCHSPFPIHGMDKAMGLKRSPLGFMVGAVAFCALTGASLMMWWMTSVDYPLVVSGKPYFSFQAYVPVAFALTILSSALTAVFGMFALNRLPRLHNPLFNSEQFNKVTDDGFYVSVLATDPKFDSEKTKQFLQSMGSTSVETVEVA
jgi:hypothetical protein